MDRTTTVTGACSVLGGAAWTAACFVQNTLPQGCIGDECDVRPMRGSSTTADVLVTLGFVLVATAAVGLLLLARQRGRIGRAARTGLATGALGAALLAVASVITVADNDWAGMPGLVVPGVVLVTVGFVLLAWTVLRAEVLPRWLAIVLLASAAFLVTANEQTTRVLLAVPFGLAWILVGAVLLRHGRASDGVDSLTV